MVYKTVIIGAGIAGISAAEKLYRSGVTDFIVLEASDRIGGRLKTFYAKGPNGEDYKFELGANWVHGVMNNPVHALATKFDLYRPLSDDKSSWKRHRSLNVTENGEKVADELHRRVFRDYSRAMGECDRCYEEGLPEGVGERTGVGEHLRTLMEPTFSHLQGEGEQHARMVFESILIQENGVSGCNDMNDVSLKYFGSYEELGGHQPTIPQGFEKLAHSIARSIPEEKILLKHRVTQINWKESDSVVLISCDNGSTFTAESVIVTLPLGVLKSQAKSLFKPSLPDKKWKSVKSLGTDAVDKVFLFYDDLDFLPAEVCKIYIARKKYESTQHWTRKIHSFHLERNPYQHILVCWLSGRAAETMESLTEREVGEGCTEVLKSVLTNPNVPHPTKVVRTCWFGDDLTHGSYMYIPTGASLDDVKTLANPIESKRGKPLVMFAGEATHSAYYSTVHGALLSGHREAERILQNI